MARGDPVFTKFDNSIRHSKKLHRLKPDERHVYWMLNIICTEERRDVLLGGSYGPSYVAREADVDRRIVLRALRRMAQVRLIELTDKWSVYVYDVRDRHRKLPFHERPIWPPNGETLIPHMGPISAPYPVEFRDQSPESGMSSYNSTDPDSENVTQKKQPAPPGPAGAVDVKKLLEEAEKESDRKRGGENPPDASMVESDEPWNQSTVESELELEVHRWFLELWPEGEYDWDAEQASLLSQVRRYGRGAYNVARVALLEARKRGEWIGNELAWMNKVAKEARL